MRAANGLAGSQQARWCGRETSGPARSYQFFGVCLSLCRSNGFRPRPICISGGVNLKIALIEMSPFIHQGIIDFPRKLNIGYRSTAALSPACFSVVGAMAFSRNGDPALGVFSDAKVLKVLGTVPHLSGL
jgi:hypothetical protein